MWIAGTVPLAKNGVDQSLTTLRIPDLATLEVRLQIQFFSGDPRHDRLKLEVGFLKLHWGRLHRRRLARQVATCDRPF